MNWKGLKGGLVLLLSITLAFPSSAAVHATAQRSSQKHRTEGSQTEKASSSSAQRSTSNWPHGTPISPESEVLKIHDKSSLISARPNNAVSDRRKFASSNGHRDRDSAASSRVHTKMLRKKETAYNEHGNRNGGGKGHGTGRGPTRKANEISESVLTAAAGHHHKSSLGSGGYFHHRNEQNRLESAAEFALRQRTPHKKTKRLKNRSDLDPMKAAALSRQRPVGSAAAETAFGGGQANRYHDAATVKVRGHGRVVPAVKGGGGGGHDDNGETTPHRSRRGQRSGGTAVSGGGGGGHGQKVRAELEHIKRMQRDLMKEISHLEHMKKKKKKVQRRSASSSSSPSSIHQQNHRQQQIAKANRK